MTQRPDLLCTEGLVESGAVDLVFNGGAGGRWYEASSAALRAAQHGHDMPSQSTVSLPSRAVISLFFVHFPDVIAAISRDNPGGKYILVIRDGDPSMREGGGPACNVRVWPGFIHHIFGINVIDCTPRVTPMPGGFWAFWEGPMEVAQVMAEPKGERENRVLVCHRHDGGGLFKPGHERLTSIEYFRQHAWATVHPRLLEPLTRPLDVCDLWPHVEHLRHVRAHDFHAIPMGYGVERAGPWECVALGMVPICYRHPEYLQFRDMPLAFVNDWREVTPEWCDATLEVIRGKRGCIEKITLSYWVERIREKRGEL